MGRGKERNQSDYDRVTSQNEAVAYIREIMGFAFDEERKDRKRKGEKPARLRLGNKSKRSSRAHKLH